MRITWPLCLQFNGTINDCAQSKKFGVWLKSWTTPNHNGKIHHIVYATINSLNDFLINWKNWTSNSNQNIPFLQLTNCVLVADFKRKFFFNSFLEQKNVVMSAYLTLISSNPVSCFTVRYANSFYTKWKVAMSMDCSWQQFHRKS